MAEITLEQVEKLRSVADVTYEEAKTALEETGGDLLSAVIRLEQAGKTRTTSGGFYSTKAGAGDPQAPTAQPLPAVKVKVKHKTKDGQTASDIFREIFDAAWNVLRHSTINQLEIWRHGTLMVSVPVLLVVVLLLFFWVSLPAAILGLFCGCRYRFSGPDLGRESVNEVMDTVADKAEEFKSYVTGPSDKTKK
ncbi:MAG: ubiquitin [Oscillospiraceae bacterium]